MEADWFYKCQSLIRSNTFFFSFKRYKKKNDFQKVIFHEFGHFLGDLEDYEYDNHDPNCYMQWVPFNSSCYCDSCVKRMKRYLKKNISRLTNFDSTTEVTD